MKIELNDITKVIKDMGDDSMPALVLYGDGSGFFCPSIDDFHAGGEKEFNSLEEFLAILENNEVK